MWWTLILVLFIYITNSKILFYINVPKCFIFLIEVRVLEIFILFFHPEKHTCTLQGFRES